MKSFRLSLAAAASSLALLTPGALTGAFAADMQVVTSIKPVHSLVAGVMEGVGEPALILQGAGSPHTYSMRPSQARMLANADLVFWVGPGLEVFLEKPLETLAGEATQVALSDSEGLTLLEMREGGAFEAHSHGDDHDDHGHEAEEDGHDHAHDHGPDAHLWLDPDNAKIMVSAIAEALSAADAENASAYAANAAALNERIAALQTELSAELEPVKDRPFIVFHDAYQYFEKQFGLAAAGSITVSPEIIPGAQRVDEIRTKVRELDAACVFAEPQFEPRLVEVVTEGTDAKSGVLDPLGAEIEDGKDLYFELMRGMAASLKTCLTK
ncbi:zinc ABC transporter substrate-binding protein ZnuA [Nitratireductor aquimarinus]|uniref:zinc ABC transporter substrate-binding protein ZnuA n=1 Tax=Nitratireductor aquimarinus TaxID=889300 RepID=UPI001A8C78EF|nr:zinc ABC transporter substrate-binding protein ZnuA [Nitratireductor aquimarinus]MBN8243237.1 zinc ABC transporter substrate-binding protein ZnuA [Nitratireductor aquimarinus]MBY6131138.1 zinc ABC transporter substrate-binding protein ZnuA [Nitratireductor aquimarinus]MCA1302106.1 zinc ABC transporter substrate-binding protein ZnuA [Nitratireductor aquimarinus]